MGRRTVHLRLCLVSSMVFPTFRCIRQLHQGNIAKNLARSSLVRCLYSHNDAAADFVNQGFFISVAPGNEAVDAVDASTRSPASESSVCNLGGTNQDDSFFKRSNYGTAVDILAPAEKVLSTLLGGKTVSCKTITSRSLPSPTAK